VLPNQKITDDAFKRGGSHLKRREREKSREKKLKVQTTEVNPTVGRPQMKLKREGKGENYKQGLPRKNLEKDKVKAETE